MKCVRVLKRLAARVPGVNNVESKTEEGRVLLRFRDGAFEDPCLARYVSDGCLLRAYGVPVVEASLSFWSSACLNDSGEV
jgi:hypothetical protein